MNLITSIGNFLGFGNTNNQIQNPQQNQKQKTNEYGTIKSEDMLPSTAFRFYDPNINLRGKLKKLERKEKAHQDLEKKDQKYQKDKKDLLNYTLRMEKIQAGSLGFLAGVAAVTSLLIYGSVTVAIVSAGLVPVIVAIAAVIFVSRKSYRKNIEKEINLVVQKNLNVPRAVRLKEKIRFLNKKIKKSPKNHHYRIARDYFIEIYNRNSPTKITIKDEQDPYLNKQKGLSIQKKRSLRRSK